MNTKGRNQFSDGHANKGQQPSVEKGEDVAPKFEAGGLSPHKKFHDPFGAPHFPPSENLPPQAKRLAMAKKKKAQQAAARKADPAHAEPQAPKAEQYPDALPRVAEAKAAVTETWSHVTHDAQPVIQEARSHWESLRDAATKIWSEAGMLLRTPGVLVRVLMDARRA